MNYLKYIMMVSLFLVANEAYSKVNMGKAAISYCKASLSFFDEDVCLSSGTTDCAVTLNSRGSQNASITVFLGGLSPQKSVIMDPFEMRGRGKDKGWISRSQLNFGGLNRGMIQVGIKQKNISHIQAVDVYVNKNRKGTEYTRYRCGKFI